MKIIKASAEIITPINREQILAHLEAVGRTCYQSEPKGDSGSFVQGLIKRGHEAIIEHASLSVRFIVDRGISHEIVRHRVASFAQESTRYCNYSKDGFGNEITVILPFYWWMFVDVKKDIEYEAWKISCEQAETAYFKLLEKGAAPQQARAVLPNSLKTELIMTANLREWRHFFKLRALGTTGKPHPQMVEVALPLFKEMKSALPEIFFDMEEPSHV